MTDTELPPDPSDFDADGALTREFLLRRGTCCENGCRNCPYGFGVAPTAASADKFNSSRVQKSFREENR